MHIEIIPFANNQSGNKIFAKITIDNKKIAKGYYDFRKEKFFIDKLFEKNINELNLSEEIILALIKKELMNQLDWELNITYET